MAEFGGLLERWKEQGIRVHGNGLAKIGMMLVAESTVQGKVPKGSTHRLTDISILPKPNQRGFTRMIKIEGYEEWFNPKRFRIVR